MNEQSRFSLDGRVAIVTGGGTGVGRGIATVFARHGATLVLAGRRQEPLENTAAELRAIGAHVLMVQADVTDVAQCQQLVDAATNEFGRLDILVNNAGGPGNLKPVEEVTPGEWMDTVGANLTSVWLMSQCASKPMLEQGRGAIVNISSNTSIHPFPMGAAYGAAKAGVNNLTAALASAWTPHGVRVNAIACGGIRTDDMLRHGQTFGFDESAIAAQILIGRIGEPEEVGYTALYFASDASSYTSGQTLVMDGGPRPG